MGLDTNAEANSIIKRNRVNTVVILSIILITIDQYTKYLAKVHLRGEAPISYFNDMLQLIYIENTGAFFGMGGSIPQPYNFILLSLIPLAVLTGLMIYVFKNIKQLSILEIITFTMIFSGGIGNIIDRVLFNTRVTDFLLMGIGSLRTGIFNVADMYVTFGVLILLFAQNKKKN